MPLVPNLSSKGSLSDMWEFLQWKYFRTAVLWLQKTSGWHPDKNIRLGRMDGLVLLKINKNEEIERRVLMYILSAKASDKKIWRILMCLPYFGMPWFRTLWVFFWSWHAFRSIEIPVHDVAFVSLCIRKDIHIQVDSMNTVSPLLYLLTVLLVKLDISTTVRFDIPRHFVFKLSKIDYESSNLRFFRPIPRHWLT